VLSLITGQRKRLFGEEYWPYGSYNAIDGDNADSVRWFFDIYLQGSRGIIPWYNFGLDMNYETADNLAILYPGRRFGIIGSVASTRLKASRKATELIRYFDAMKRYLNYSDKQLAAYVKSYITMESEHVMADSVDAGTAVFTGGTGAMEEMKRDMHRRLSAAVNMYF